MERLLLHGFGYVVHIEGHFAFAELGGVERLQVVVVECRMLLRQAEGLVRPAFLVDVAEVGLAVEAVVALRGEDKPAAVRAPGVVGVALGAVHDGEAVCRPRCQVHHLKVCLGVPDGECAVVGHRVEQEAAVGRDARVADGRGRGQCVDLCADGARCLIEGNAHEAILQGLDVCRQADAVGCAVIDVLAVGREGGEGLELQAVAQQGRGDNPLLLHIGYEDIRGGIVDLQALAGIAVEGWDNLLGGVGDIAPAGAESEIDAPGNVQLA